MTYLKLCLIYIRLKNDESGSIILEMSIIIAALVIFLAIAIPGLLGHIGSLITRSDTKLDGMSF